MRCRDNGQMCHWARPIEIMDLHGGRGERGGRWLCHVTDRRAPFDSGSELSTEMLMKPKRRISAFLLASDLPAYSDTVYSDTPLTGTLLACPK